MTFGDGSPGSVTMDLYAHLTGLQAEREKDLFGWLHEVPDLG